MSVPDRYRKNASVLFAAGFETDTKLRFLFLLTTYLSLFMVSWILILPSSWLIGCWDFHDDLVLLFTAPHVPPDLSHKFQGHWAIHLTHILPGAIWAGAIPFQLHPTWRKQHKRLHRIAGYAFLSASVLMTIGVVLILQRGLLFENFFDDLPPLAGIHRAEVWLVPTTVHFLLSSIMALIMVLRGNYMDHQRWVLRHIASGIWISLQRNLAIALAPFYQPPIYYGEVARETQRALFGNTGKVSIVATTLLAEYAIALLNEKARSRTAKHKKES